MIADVLQEHLDNVGKQSKCLVGKWLDTQDKKVNALFVQLLQRPDLNISGLYRDLRSSEINFRLTTFKSHMRGTCPCPKA